MIKPLFAACLIAFASNTFAGPAELEIIGIVPGKSTQADVEKAKGEIGYVIGGFELVCIPEYMDGVLSQFLCLTGGKYYSRDKTSDSYRNASNIEVHKVLLEGFTKKFGKPTAIDNDSVSNALGQEFNRNVVVWIDEKGNKLMISSLATKVDEGMLVLESAAKVKADKADKKKADQMRNF